MDISQAVDEYDGDVYLYFGEISRSGYSNLSALLEAKTDKKPKVCLIPATFGGDPNAAFRIARALSHHYETVEILVADICKSAGTLLCVGANRLIFGDRGELGPLDIQLSKPDEMFESISGLAITQAFSAIEAQMLNSFQSYWISIRNGAGLRTKLAADIAARLAEGFIAPIAAKIDPVTLGEHQRAMQIAFDYGQRLGEQAGNLQDGGLVSLVSSYPSHGFVIDRKEARTIFFKVDPPSGPTKVFYNVARGVIDQKTMAGEPLVLDLSDIPPSNESDTQEETDYEENNGSDGLPEREDETSDGQADGQSQENVPNGDRQSG